MSEQADALAKWARQHGLELPAGHGLENPPEDAPEDLRNKLWIELVGGDRLLGAFAKDIGAVLSCNGVFRRDRIPVTINVETGAMEPMDDHRFRSYVEKHVVPFKWVAVSGKRGGMRQQPQTMPVSTATGTLKADQFIEQQRPLVKVNFVRMPIMRNDGKIELLPEGYDVESKIYTQPSEVVCSAMAVDKARAILRDYLKEFPFLDDRSRAVQVAAMLAMFGYHLLPLTSPRMNFVYDANKSRSGKTLLAIMALAPTVGDVAVRTLPEKEKDLETVIEATTLGSKPYLLLDDLEGMIKNRTLNAFLTASHVDVRIFHTQRLVAMPKVSTAFLTGNNLQLTADITGRSLTCKLFVEEADVQARPISRVITERYLTQPHIRSEFVSAMWSIIKAWDEAGRPKGQSSLQGFQEWSNIFGGMVEFAGFGDPLAPMGEDEGMDPNFEDMRTLVTAAAGMIKIGVGEKTASFEFKQLVEICRERNCFTNVIEGKERVEKDDDGKVIERHFDLSAKAKSILGKIFTDRYGGSIFSVKMGDNVLRVRFGERGRKRDKRYHVTIVD